MEILSKRYVPMNVGQLKELIADIDDDKPIRVWVECRNKDDTIYLQGRKLAGVLDEEDMVSLCAMYYLEDEV